ncbi:Protein of unknown function [Fontimonas thermophila]|uniref:DUF3047 domain-containing protein n=1 Tax=Fontimonas thermophila TaxID=1076937 RepID=A0A1I2KKD5_9GAMM|nr:DUF3047 domain-containing protein [Fontimonas thermophila]SFF66700.1 Protein of unknown function [Fontimonas thermophila]
MTRGLWLALLWPAALAAQILDVGRFEAESVEIPAPWRLVQPSTKVPPTRYRLRAWDGVMAIEARAEASMAMLARPLTVDLGQTPVLCWRWRIEAPLRSADLRTKSGDDFAARVYLSLSVDPAVLTLSQRLKLALGRQLYGRDLPDAAINYVWDNTHPVGFTAPNAYTDLARMMVLESGAGRAQRWVEERRDVLTDARTLFGTDRIRAIQLAVASDTDNTGETAHAGFADFHFVGKDQACVFTAPSLHP